MGMGTRVCMAWLVTMWLPMVAAKIAPQYDLLQAREAPVMAVDRACEALGDDQQAYFHCIQDAAAEGHVVAQMVLATLYHDGAGVAQDGGAGEVGDLAEEVERLPFAVAVLRRRRHVDRGRRLDQHDARDHAVRRPHRLRARHGDRLHRAGAIGTDDLSRRPLLPRQRRGRPNDLR